jgi:hypothetical protein
MPAYRTYFGRTLRRYPNARTFYTYAWDPELRMWVNLGRKEKWRMKTMGFDRTSRLTGVVTTTGPHFFYRPVPGYFPYYGFYPAED